MLGVAFVIFQLFLIIYHAPEASYNINNLLYLTTSIPFILLPAILLKKNKNNKRSSVSLIVSTIIGFIVVVWSTFYIIYHKEVSNQLYLVPFYGALVTFIVYVCLFYPFNRNKS